MLNKLREAEEQYEHLEASLSDPAVMADSVKCAQVMKDYKSLSPIIEKYREYKRAEQTVSDALELLESTSDAELRLLANEELKESRALSEALLQELTVLLLPRDPNDEKNVIVEIRAGAGGEEAALFAAVLFRMYTMYAASIGYRCSMLNQNPTELGGYRQLAFQIEGDGAYSRFKYESGVHRVQRVPDTETQGRIHTSTVTVAVLPEADDVELEINPADLKIDTFRSSGAGGQHINKTSSAIRVTHIPTGTVVECQDERSQFKNKDKALRVLRARLLDVAQREHDEAIASDRRSQVGTGDRSERIRTYNFPQGRVTDHRIGLTLYRLESVMNGDLDEIVDSLITYYRTEALKNQEEG